MKKVVAFLLAALMMLACFAGCAQNNTDNRPLIVVGYTDYPPMNYTENGELVGFDTDLAKAVFDNLGYQVQFKEINWDNKYTDLSSGTIDCIWNGFTCNTADPDGVARAEKVDFSYNYMENQQVVVVKKGSNITSAADLKDKFGMAEAGSAGYTYASETLECANVKEASTQMDAIKEVNFNTRDFAVVDFQLANSCCGKGDYAELTIVEDLSSDIEYYAVGFEKGSELTAKVNAEFEKLGAGGTITEIAKKYGVENTAVIDYSSQKK